MTASSGGSWINAIYDEVALEGLEGVTLPYLWDLLARRLEFAPAPLPDRIREQTWTLLLRTPSHKIEFFELPVERPLMPYYDRINDMDEQLGVPVVPEQCPFMLYPPAYVQEGDIKGNCTDFKSRKRIASSDLQGLNATQATEQWAGKLVVVASQELRETALTADNLMMPENLPLPNYIFLEAIGRSRYSGQTTGGPWSLMNYSKDTGILFYIKNKLINLQLIIAQNYNEINKGRILVSSLLMLPRFYRIYKNHSQENLEKLYLEIMRSSSRQVPVSEITELLGRPTNFKTKKLLVTHAFRKFFETKQVERPNHTLTKSGKQSKATTRKVTVIQLRNPDMQLKDLYKNEENEENSVSEFLDLGHCYLDMPPEEEVFRAVARFGKRGLNSNELCHYTGINATSMRHFVKRAKKNGVFREYSEQVGKSRRFRFVAVGHLGDLAKDDTVKKKNLEIKCKDEPHITESTDVLLKDMPEIVTNARPMAFKIKKTKVANQTQRQMNRQKMIVRQIDQNCLVALYRLQKALQETERQAGFKDSLCRRSLMRLLRPMVEDHIINVFEITLNYNQQVRIYRFATHPKIGLDHPVMKREIAKLKSNFHLISEERMKRPSQMHPRERKEVLARRKMLPERPGAVFKTQAPKLFLAKTLHEFLYYLHHELPHKQQALTMSADLVQQWQKSEPALQPRQFFDEWQANENQVVPYTEDIGWRTFIPPLPRYEDKPSGWLYFMDAMDRMPLSLFMRICRIERETNDELRLQLQHPIRQHYLLSQLKLETIVPRLKLQQLYVGTLRLLNNMGLIQVSEQKLGRDSLHRWVYLNQRTSLLDTTSSTEHNYMQVSADRTYTKLSFEFSNVEQLDNYWAKLQHICIYTKLGYRKSLSTQRNLPERLKGLVFQPTVEFDQAVELDNGTVPGDHLGAAGLNSHLFAHHFRHWSWVQRQNGGKSNAAREKAKRPVRKRAVITRLKIGPRLAVRKTRELPDGKTIKKSSGPRDDIDRDALRNMRTLRVKWAPEEDRLLKMGRAVYMFIDAPTMTLALCDLAIVCRDLIRRWLGICNKTTQSCVRRVQFMVKMKRDIPDVPSWIYAMQTQPQFTTVYNDRFLGQLKQDYPNKNDFQGALMTHFALMMAKLQRMIAKSQGSVSQQFLLPDSLDAFGNQLRECRSAHEEQQLLFQDPATEADLQVAVAHGVLHSNICCAKDKTLLNLQTFEIYKHFSEDVLNSAFNKARADSLLVAVKRRNIQSAASRQITGPGHLLSSKYKYRLIYTKLTHFTYDGYFALDQKLRTDQEHHLSSPHFAQLLVIGEWLLENRLNLSLNLPANILTVDTSSLSRQSGCASDRILDHYSSMFDNAPQTEYSKRLESECNGRHASRVRFHPGNLSFRLPTSPYNQLSKLQLRCMHFFCALDALGEAVTISMARLEQGDCPFTNCIMRSGNYLNAVERIAHEQRPILRQLVADALPSQQFQLELHPSGTPFTVTNSTLLPFAQQLEEYWRRKQQGMELKDLGKALAERTLHKLTDWRSICAELLDDEPHGWEPERVQEYEPALNKEERARAQDVFVVHLPTIGMHVVEQPECKQAIDSLRNSVLGKVLQSTYWQYTENTFDTLRPILLEKGFDDQAIRHMEDILNHIEQHTLGAKGLDLRRIFPLGDFLFETLHILADHGLIKRVGIVSIMYVHKNHIRNWVVHTFHIKRLEREKVQPMVAAAPGTLLAVVGHKRKLEAQETDSSVPEKKAKIMEQQSTGSESDEASGSAAKRPKRITRKEPAVVVANSTLEASRDAIAMRPQPWIRVNASLNRRVLDRWLGVVLSECISRIGCTVQSLFLRFSHLVPVDIMFLLELLHDLGCLQLMEIRTRKVHVESLLEDDEDGDENQVTELYDPTQTYVQVHGNAIGKLTNFIGVKKYSTEFI
ncbi:general transcription factor 3C polypeptide 1 [Drosophila eugracilis]|uniref:general transcription factor 3C polypeptide 1 n=1 Tax=Drosophila eugracilis TaxID=29029 RepID=UPI001BD95D72|nr:general transcription factor 3C polypeptide 1 [Drosophila eugracilis]